MDPWTFFFYGERTKLLFFFEKLKKLIIPPYPRTLISTDKETFEVPFSVDENFFSGYNGDKASILKEGDRFHIIYPQANISWCPLESDLLFPLEEDSSSVWVLGYAPERTPNRIMVNDLLYEKTGFPPDVKQLIMDNAFTPLVLSADYYLFQISSLTSRRHTSPFVESAVVQQYLLNFGIQSQTLLTLMGMGDHYFFLRPFFGGEVNIDKELYLTNINPEQDLDIFVPYALKRKEELRKIYPDIV
ncbi:MAG: hypothetical protein ACO1RX_02960 [Candidatus Sericytochromatia bacterium]